MRPLIVTYAWLLTRLPEAFARCNAAVLGRLLWLIRGKVIRRNLAQAFPDKDAAWVLRIGRTSCRRTAEMGLFSIASPMMSEAEIRDRIVVDESVTSDEHGLPPKGTGAVLFVPHFALMEMMTATTLLRPELAKREWVVIYRPLDQAAAERWVKEARERFGMKLASRREGFARSMKAVREGQVAAILFDQTTQSGSNWQFLGAPCAVTELPGIIAQRFKCPSRIYWADRTGFWRCRLRMEALRATDSIGLTIESNRWLEEKLRSGDDTCANWLWAHDRWKHGRHPFKKLGE
ncbi:MAG: lysophospholipid acyltransferase family protein [Opitutales bacterium]